MDKFDELMLGRPSTPIPEWAIIPRVVVRREWPYFDEDADQESLQYVVDEVYCLWDRISGVNNRFDDPEFFGPTAEFWIDGDEITPSLGNSGDGRVALANVRFAESRWQELFSKSCWKGVATYPPVNVMAKLIEEYLSGTGNAFSVLLHDVNHSLSIQILENGRREGVTTVAPTMAAFLSSVWAAGVERRIGTDKPIRDDTPNETEIANGMSVLGRMGTRNPSVEAFRDAYRNAGYKGSNKKISAILGAMKDSSG